MLLMLSSSHRRLRRGTVAALVALLLTVLIGILAIGIDGGMMMDNRRQVQAAADLAALAAAIDLYQNYAKNGGVDTGGTANSSAVNTASTNGFNSSNATVTVNLYPNNAQMSQVIGVGKQVPMGYAEVIITFKQPRYFGAIWGTGTVPITVYAVARAQWNTTNNGIIALNPTAQGALNTHGNGSIYVNGASIIVDSNNTYAITSTASALVSNSGAGNVIITGSNPGYSGNVEGTILTGQMATPDPLAYLPPPDPSTLMVQTVPAPNGGTIYLEPGKYSGGISISSSNNVKMDPGIYYMDGGGFSISLAGSATLTGNGVMIYATSGITIAGNGTATLSPPTSGPYTGITMFESRSYTGSISVTGNGTFKVSGTMYNAGGQTAISGNGDVSLAGQLISNTIDIGGNGNTNINWGSAPTARTRVIQLVE